MSQQNVETARRAFAAFASGGTEALLAFCSEDVVTYPFPEWMEEPVYHGRDGFRELLSGWTEGFDQFVPRGGGAGRRWGDIVVWLGYNAGRIKRDGDSDPADGQRVLRSARDCSPRPTTS
jgi:ketosteroid isomerase-like protein